MAFVSNYKLREYVLLCHLYWIQLQCNLKALQGISAVSLADCVCGIEISIRKYVLNNLNESFCFGVENRNSGSLNFTNKYGFRLK